MEKVISKLRSDEKFKAFFVSKAGKSVIMDQGVWVYEEHPESGGWVARSWAYKILREYEDENKISPARDLANKVYTNVFKRNGGINHFAAACGMKQGTVQKMLSGEIPVNTNLLVWSLLIDAFGVKNYQGPPMDGMHQAVTILGDGGTYASCAITIFALDRYRDEIESGAFHEYCIKNIKGYKK